MVILQADITVPLTRLYLWETPEKLQLIFNYEVIIIGQVLFKDITTPHYYTVLHHRYITIPKPEHKCK